LILYECIKINIVNEMSNNQSVILFYVVIVIFFNIFTPKIYVNR